MDLQSLFSFQTLFLALGVAVLVHTARQPIENKWKTLLTNTTYTKVVLPTAAVLAGGVLAMFSSVLPVGLADASLVDRFIHGAIAGGFSTYVFRAAKGLIAKNVEEDRQ